MPIVSPIGDVVNPETDVQTLYQQAISLLSPKDVPCIYCDYDKTHAHGTYPRKPYAFFEVREDWNIHRRLCPSPACKRTFGLLPATLAPYARFVILAQDGAVEELAQGTSYEETAILMDEQGVCLSDSTLHRWFGRMQGQTREILPALSSLLQNQIPDQLLSPLRSKVRDVHVCAYYDRLQLWGARHSGSWNVLRRIICLFAPPLSGNRVSYGLSPG